jgi:lytic cellulose monooxygenase (C1-hydroxylating)
LYKETDPGILVNIYTTGLSYTIPGPALYNGGNGAAATTNGAVSYAPTTLATSTTTYPPAVTPSAAPYL